MVAHLKGNALLPSMDYIRDTFGESVWREILQALEPEERHQVSFVQGANLYSVALLGKVLSALVEIECPGDRAAAEQLLRKMGRDAADQQLTGIYSLFVRFSSPGKSFSRIAQVVQTLYEGATAELEYTPGESMGVVHIRGLGDCAYASPRLCGWAERALERSGAKTACVVERSWAAGETASDDFAFDVTWT